MRIRKLFQPIVLLTVLIAPASAQDRDIPHRETPRPETTQGVPHVQLNVESFPELNNRLLDCAANLPDMDLRPTVVSLPGATGFWLDDDLDLDRPDVIVRGREFAHMHPDGSLHASLDPKDAKLAVDAGWATPHPWADQRAGWEGFVMIYTPQTEEEVSVVFDLVVWGYEFVTGRDIDLACE